MKLDNLVYGLLLILVFLGCVLLNCVLYQYAYNTIIDVFFINIASMGIIPLSLTLGQSFKLFLAITAIRIAHSPDIFKSDNKHDNKN